MQLVKLNKRSKQGQMIVILCMVIAVLVLLTIGTFSFEITRVESARNQLRAATEAAALAGAASLAGSDITDTMSAHRQAVNTALQMFQQNNVVGVALNTATTAGSPDTIPGIEKSAVYIEFLDPNNNNVVVQMGNPAGKVLRVTGIFGLNPAFASFLSLPAVTLQTQALGGVPDLDIVVCFDVSGSIDDQSLVTFVKRQWQPSSTKNIYTVTSTRAGSPAGALARGTIFNILGPPATGTRVNTVYPEYLGLADSGVSYPLSFSPGLRGSSDSGSPPGNYPPGNAPTGNAQTFTDLVVNLDGKQVFAGYTSPDGYQFPDIATLVEAARGNLDDQLSFVNSKANTGVPSNIQARAGYKAKYMNLAALNSHPLYDAKDAAGVFFNVLNNNTDAHFGFITFADNAGQNAGGTFSDYKIDSSYSSAGTLQVPLPNISLNSSPQVSNYSAVQSAIPGLAATTSTNIGDAVSKAVTQLKQNSRIGAKRAIVLFTDGQPTAGGPLSSEPWTNARMAAVQAKNEGIPIYTIGLAQTPAIIPGEVAILNDTNPDPSTGGMAAIAGNGGHFYLVTDVNKLRYTFEHIARCLVQLVR